MKTLKITNELHANLKKYCKDNDLKLNSWVEKQLLIKLKEILGDGGREIENNR